jgi:hypothetical protein
MSDVVILTCLASGPGPHNLDGRTGDGTVGLAPHLGAPFTGTRWRRRMSNDVWTLECLGDAPGPARFLDGRIADDSVGLAPNTQPPFTGTRWRARRVGDGFTLQCLAAQDAPRFLDGRIGNGTVGLAPTTDPPFTGTHWRVGVPFGDDVEENPVSG